MGRTVTLALVDPDGRPLGTTRPYEVEPQWWQEVAPVVAGARAEFGIEVTVLRLAAAENAAPHGGSGHLPGGVRRAAARTGAAGRQVA
ncbi:hypothetical protein [Kutzneria kofuensis]|uniref:hypothetical protein n=1 Tax=Kutzneria kofuensis TaxID=103725 RepID=UPI0031ED6126